MRTTCAYPPAFLQLALTLADTEYCHEILAPRKDGPIHFYVSSVRKESYRVNISEHAMYNRHGASGFLGEI